MSKVVWAVAAMMLIPYGLCMSQIPDKVEPSASPTPPCVAVVPDFAQWTMEITTTVKRDAKGASLPPTPAPATPSATAVVVQKVVSTKTKDIKRDILFYTNGKQAEIWYDKDYVIVRSPNKEFQLLKAGSRDAAFYVPDVSGLGFIGVDWITPDKFQGKVKTNEGTVAYVYKGTSNLVGAAFPAPIPTPDGKLVTPTSRVEEVPTAAMVAADSHLPLIIEKDIRTFTYSFQAAPTDMLQLPDDVQKRIAIIAEKESYLDQMRKLQH